MIIASPWSGDSLNYARMAWVLEHSAKRHNPGADVRIPNIDQRSTTRSPAFLAKSRAWTEIVHSVPIGSELVLLDTDTLVLGPLGGAFDREDWDLAVTTRGCTSTLNSGVLFVRVSQRARDWIAPWAELTEPWCARNEPGRVRFGDQDALKDMVRGRPGAALRALPCKIWNAEQHCWPPVEGCKILHVKSDARRLLFGGTCHGNPGADVVAEMWRAEERAASPGIYGLPAALERV